MKTIGKIRIFDVFAGMMLLAAVFIAAIQFDRNDPSVTGMWYAFGGYSGDTLLTLDLISDGSYSRYGYNTDSSGSYSINKNIIEMKGMHGYFPRDVIMQISTDKTGEPVIICEGNPNVYYLRTKEKAYAYKEEKARIEKCMEKMYLSSAGAAAKRIFTEGDWVCEESSHDNRALSFTENTFTLIYGTETRTFTYEITEADIDVYKQSDKISVSCWVYMEVKNEDGKAADIHHMRIAAEKDITLQVVPNAFQFSGYFYRTD